MWAIGHVCTMRTVGPSRGGVEWLIVSVILSSQVDVCIYVEQFILFPRNS